MHKRCNWIDCRWNALLLLLPPCTSIGWPRCLIISTRHKLDAIILCLVSQLPTSDCSAICWPQEPFLSSWAPSRFTLSMTQTIDPSIFRRSTVNSVAAAAVDELESSSDWSAINNMVTSDLPPVHWLLLLMSNTAMPFQHGSCSIVTADDRIPLESPSTELFQGHWFLKFNREPIEC